MKTILACNVHAFSTKIFFLPSAIFRMRRIQKVNFGHRFIVLRLQIFCLKHLLIGCCQSPFHKRQELFWSQQTGLCRIKGDLWTAKFSLQSLSKQKVFSTKHLVLFPLKTSPFVFSFNWDLFEFVHLGFALCYKWDLLDLMHLIWD